MIRNLLAIGIITGFIASAFIPPTNAQPSAFALPKVSETTMNKVGVTVVQAISTFEKSEIKKTMQSSLDSFALSQIERIEWAIKKKDIRLCNDLANAVERDESKNVEKYSAGEYIALCVAMMMNDSARCHQIFSKSDTVLKRFCHDELAST